MNNGVSGTPMIMSSENKYFNIQTRISIFTIISNDWTKIHTVNERNSDEIAIYATKSEIYSMEYLDTRKRG